MGRPGRRGHWREPEGIGRSFSIRGRSDCAEKLKFPGSQCNANCALRTLRRMLHKAEEWKVIGRAPKITLWKEHGRPLRLDEEAKRKLLDGALACKWRNK